MNANDTQKDLKNLPKLSKDQVDLIKNTVAKNATDDELKLFLYQANRTGLDPLARQIYFVKRATQATIQTSIDGFRIIAERSGKYAGQDEPEFEETSDGKLVKCCVAVYKFSPNGDRYKAAVGVAYWDEYKPGNGQDFMWNKMPHTMLAKVAEALALRKAFPQDLSGLYTNEEMEQDREVETVIENMSEGDEITEKQKAMIQYQRDRVGMTNEELIRYIEKMDVEDPYEMKKEEASRVIDSLIKERAKRSRSSEKNA